MILYIENLKDSTKKTLLEVLNELSEVAGYKISVRSAKGEAEPHLKYVMGTLHRAERAQESGVCMQGKERVGGHPGNHREPPKAYKAGGRGHERRGDRDG